MERPSSVVGGPVPRQLANNGAISKTVAAAMRLDLATWLVDWKDLIN